MTYQAYLRIVFHVISICICLCGCESVLDSVIYSATTPQKQIDADLKRVHQNPNLLNEEAERDSRAEVYRNTKRQEESEEAARRKKFDDAFDKQMRRSQ